MFGFLKILLAGKFDFSVRDKVSRDVNDVWKVLGTLTISFTTSDENKILKELERLTVLLTPEPSSDVINELKPNKNIIRNLFFVYLKYLHTLLALAAQISAQDIYRAFTIRCLVLQSLSALYQNKKLDKEQLVIIKDFYQQIEAVISNEANDRIKEASDFIAAVAIKVNQIEASLTSSSLTERLNNKTYTAKEIMLITFDFVTSGAVIFHLINTLIVTGPTLTYFGALFGISAALTNPVTAAILGVVLAGTFIWTLSKEIYFHRDEFRNIWKSDPSIQRKGWDAVADFALKVGQSALLAGKLVVKSLVKTVFSNFLADKVAALNIKEWRVVKFFTNMFSLDEDKKEIAALQQEVREHLNIFKDPMQGKIKSQINVSIQKIDALLIRITKCNDNIREKLTDQLASLRFVRGKLEYADLSCAAIETLPLANTPKASPQSSPAVDKKPEPSTLSTATEKSSPKLAPKLSLAAFMESVKKSFFPRFFVDKTQLDSVTRYHFLKEKTVDAAVEKSDEPILMDAPIPQKQPQVLRIGATA